MLKTHDMHLTVLILSFRDVVSDKVTFSTLNVFLTTFFHHLIFVTFPTPAVFREKNVILMAY